MTEFHNESQSLPCLDPELVCGRRLVSDLDQAEIGRDMLDPWGHILLGRGTVRMCITDNLFVKSFKPFR